MILDEKLTRGDVLILDGGVGSEIRRVGGPMHDAAWCGVAHWESPQIVRQVHEAYLEAGADIITTNTFSSCRHVLAGAGLAQETEALNRLAVELAREALDRAAVKRPVAIAGSLSNNLAWLPGTQSADPRFLPSLEEEAANYREQAETLAHAGVDLLLLEMMLDLTRAPVLIEAASETGLPVWVGLSATALPNGRMVCWNMRAEEPHRLHPRDDLWRQVPFEDLIDKVISFGPQAVGVMHTAVPAMPAALDELFTKWHGTAFAYPEVQTQASVEFAEGATISPAALAGAASKWIELGVQVIGGCCGTTVDHIRGLSQHRSSTPVN